MDTHAHSTLSVAAKVFMAIAIIGALNWGLIGLFNFNLVAAIFGEGSAASRLVYALVGLAGLAAAFLIPWGSRHTRQIGEGTHLRRRSTV